MKDNQRYQAETALIQALAFFRDGQSELALEMAIIAVGRIGATISEAVVARVSGKIADRIKEARPEL